MHELLHTIRRKLGLPQEQLPRKPSNTKLLIEQVQEEKTGWRASLQIGHISQRYTLFFDTSEPPLTFTLRNDSWYRLRAAQLAVEKYYSLICAIYAQHTKPYERLHDPKLAMEVDRLAQEMRDAQVGWLIPQIEKLATNSPYGLFFERYQRGF